MSKKFDNAVITISALGNIVYIAEVSKTNPQLMTANRRKVPDAEFLPVVVEFLKNATQQYDEKGKRVPGRGHLDITIDNKPRYRIRLEEITPDDAETPVL